MLTSVGPGCPVSVACPAHAGKLSGHLHKVPSFRGSRAARLSSSSQTQRDHCNRLSCVVNATDSSHRPERSHQEVEAELRDAVRLEQYSRAAELRDLLKTLPPENTAAALKKKLDKLVADEQYEEAAAVRDQLRAVVHKNIEDARERTSSDTVTGGVRIKVRSFFVPSQSYPQQHQYFFMYAITITNEGTDTVQLLNRHWIIHNAHGQKQEVRGPGVVGETPVLEPGKAFEYNSACPLATATGTMQGEFEMIRVNDIDESTQKPTSFQAKIAQFALDMQQAVMI